MNNGYVMLPAWLLATRPSANAILVYATLARYGKFDTYQGIYDECRPALATIAADAGTSVSTVKRAVAELLEIGAVERAERLADDGRTQLPSVYRLIFEQGGFTGEPRGGSTGEPRGGSPVSQDPEPLTQNQDTQKPSTSSRGTRLPEGWLPDESLKAWARENTPGLGWAEHEKFVDYWRAQPGAKGRKADWSATWRNWMRRAYEQLPGAGKPAVAQFKSAAVQNQEKARREKAHARLVDMATQAPMCGSLDEAISAADELMQEWTAQNVEDFLVKGVFPCDVEGYIDVVAIDQPEILEVNQP